MNAAPSQRWAVACLGTTQTLAWASSYYLPAMLAAPMARDLGVSTPTVFAAFSLALVVSALLGPLAGHAIDRHGGRPVLLATNMVFALALAQGPVTLFAAWALMGIAMGSGLYEAAFASLVRLYGEGARNAITGVTLFAGFASTIGWPLSAWMESAYGWRGACLGWAALHLLLGLPLNAWLPRIAPPLAATLLGTKAEPQHPPTCAPPRPSVLLCCCHSCLPSPGSSAQRWRHTCPACYRPAACHCMPPWRWPHWWGLPKCWRACWSLACCAACTL